MDKNALRKISDEITFVVLEIDKQIKALKKAKEGLYDIASALDASVYLIEKEKGDIT